MHVSNNDTDWFLIDCLKPKVHTSLGQKYWTDKTYVWNGKGANITCINEWVNEFIYLFIQRIASKRDLE